jgi:2-phosphosulfolactate phosphatase
LDPARLHGKVVVVFDVLFATTTITKVLAEGATEVVPMLDETAARNRARHLEDGSFMLAGEKHAQTLDGFGPFAPLALSREAVGGKQIIYATTNGTVALRRSEKAAHVYAACLSNGAAMAAHLCQWHRGHELIVLCSGSVGGFNLEDFVGAGHLLEHIDRTVGNHWSLTDSSLAALELYRRGTPLEYLRHCRVGRLIYELGLEEELIYSARMDILELVPKLENGIIRPTQTSG